PADLVVDNRSNLVKVVAAPVVRHKTYRNAREPIYDVLVIDVRQASHVDWPDLAQSPSPSPAAFRPVGVYNDNFRTLMPDRETAYWTSDGTLLRPELCNNKIVLDPCQMCLTVPDNTLTWGLLTPTVPRVSSSLSVAPPQKKKKIWKQGEYPGDVSGSDRNKNRRTPIKNIKKIDWIG
ncbi:hypothetical protein Tco_0630998, partial [Tanacetum coccineum]